MKFLLGVGRVFVGVLLLITVAYLIVDGDRLVKVSATPDKSITALSPAR